MTYERLVKKEFLSLDTETDGLDFRTCALRLVTICTSDRTVYMIHHPDESSVWLKCLLSHGFATKLFHHALFDIRFIKAGLGIEVQGPVECTKTLIKMVRPDIKSGLASACKHLLGVKLAKKADHSKWKNDFLTKSQKEYAAEDTLYLQPLVKEIKKFAPFGALSRYRDAILAIRIKAALDVEGFTDLLDYAQAETKDTQEYRAWWQQKEVFRFPNQDVYAKGGEGRLN